MALASAAARIGAIIGSIAGRHSAAISASSASSPSQGDCARAVASRAVAAGGGAAAAGAPPNVSSPSCGSWNPNRRRIDDAPNGSPAAARSATAFERTATSSGSAIARSTFG